MRQTPQELERFLRVDHRSPIPVYLQLMESVKEVIYRGKLKAGDRLPPVRALAQALDINPNTVARAYQELERQGILSARVGRGTFLTEPRGGSTVSTRQSKLEALLGEIRQRCAELGVSQGELLKSIEKIE